jgi:hypothetical protein
MALTETFSKRYRTELVNSSREKSHIRPRKVYYGCFQALILDRLFPGWQKSLCTKKRLLDQELADRLPMSGDDTARARTRLATLYGYNEVEECHRLLISRRDSAYREMKNRSGMTYILDFKPIRDPVSSHIAREREFYSLGLMRLYPAGVGSFTTGRISVSTTHPTPVEMNQIFYLKLVDTCPQRAREPYRLTCEKQEGAVFHHATITTPLFQVVAPKVQVVERKNRVKIIFLSRE